MLLLNLYLHLYLLSAPNELKWRFSMLHGKFSEMVAQMSFPETKSSKFWKLEFPEWVITSWWPEFVARPTCQTGAAGETESGVGVVAGITGMKHWGVGQVFVAGGGQHWQHRGAPCVHQLASQYRFVVQYITHHTQPYATTQEGRKKKD